MSPCHQKNKQTPKSPRKHPQDHISKNNFSSRKGWLITWLTWDHSPQLGSPVPCEPSGARTEAHGSSSLLRWMAFFLGGSSRKVLQGSRWYPMLKFWKWWLPCHVLKNFNWKRKTRKKTRWWSGSNDWKVKVTSFWDPYIKLVANSGQEGEGKGSNPFTKTDDSPIWIGLGAFFAGVDFPFQNYRCPFHHLFTSSRTVRRPGFPAVGTWSQCHGRFPGPFTQPERLQLMMLAEHRDDPIRRWAYWKTVPTPLWNHLGNQTISLKKLVNELEHPFPTVLPLVHWNR